MSEIQGHLEKIRELSARVVSEELSSAERVALQKELDSHITAIKCIAEETEVKTATFTGGPSTGIH